MREMKRKLDNYVVDFETRGQGKPFIMLNGADPDHRSMIGRMEPMLRKRKGW
jgi:hypothetical protein